jgi:hypothetical protein
LIFRRTHGFECGVSARRARRNPLIATISPTCEKNFRMRTKNAKEIFSALNLQQIRLQSKSRKTRTSGSSGVTAELFVREGQDFRRMPVQRNWEFSLRIFPLENFLVLSLVNVRLRASFVHTESQFSARY